VLHELVSVALGGGLPLVAALDLARSAAIPLAGLLPIGPPPRRADDRRERGPGSGEIDGGGGGSALDDAARDVDDLIGLAHRSGAALTPLLLARADLRRRRHSAASRARIERLATDLLAPLGLCSLPAFLLLGVAPALLAVVSSTVR
jgi:hypothetical protein